MDDVLSELDNKYDMEYFNPYIHCIMMDKCEGQSYDTNKGATR